MKYEGEWVHQNYGMNRIIWKLQQVEKNARTLLLLEMFDWIDKTMNER